MEEAQVLSQQKHITRRISRSLKFGNKMTVNLIFSRNYLYFEDNIPRPNEYRKDFYEKAKNFYGNSKLCSKK